MRRLLCSAVAASFLAIGAGAVVAPAAQAASCTHGLERQVRPFPQADFWLAKAKCSSFGANEAARAHLYRTAQVDKYSGWFTQRNVYYNTGWHDAPVARSSGYDVSTV